MKYTLTLIVLFIVTTVGLFSQWKEINNGVDGGPISMLAEHNGILYACGNWNGLFVSYDSAVTWKSIGNSLLHVQVRQIIHSNGNIIIATSSGFMYYSTDSGTTWNMSDSLGTQSTSMAVKGDTVITATNSKGVFISTNKGVSWSQCDTSTLATLDISGIVLHNNILFAATNGGGLFMSTNYGTRWISKNEGLSGNKLLSLSIAGDTIFTSVGGEVFFSYDNASTWNRITGLPSTYGVKKMMKYSLGLVGLSATGVYYSSDSGSTWKNVSPFGYFFGSLSCQATGSKLIIALENLNGQPSGVFASLDSGKTWSVQSKGIHCTTVLSFAQSNSTLYIGTLGNGMFRSTNYGELWEPVNRMYGMDNIHKLLVHGDTILAGTQNAGLYVSYNKGDTWQKSGSFFSVGMGVLSLHKENNTIYLGTNRSGDGLYTTTDFGKTWAEKKKGFVDNIAIKTICAQGDTIVTGFYNGVYVSTNKGENWQLPDSPLRKEVRSMLYYRNNFWAAVDSLGLVCTSDIGKNWITKNNGLSNLGVHTIVQCGNALITATRMSATFQHGNWVYNNGGIWASLTNGDTWINITSNYPIPDVTFLAADSSTLYVGREGIGLYTANLADFNLSDVNEYTATQQSAIIFPNPGSSLVTVVVPQNTQPQMVELFDILGNSVLQQSVTPNCTEVTLNISTLPKGTYTVRTGLLHTLFIKL
ncbi:MAG: T9SS type A sorting domain-containing protein [Bacteriodetes bacterium]|nr:T9SS type A sorting domain-containing protein [Bacteroidota bacterium]